MATVVYGVTEKGFVPKPVAEVITSLNNRFIGAFGSTFDVTPEGPDGQVIGIVADEIAQCWDQAEAAFNAYRPGATEGVGLSNIAELTHVVRIENQPSTVGVYLDGQEGTYVPQGSLVSDGTMEFSIMYNTRIPGLVTAKATQTGEYSVAASTVNKIVTEIDGWTSVNNPESGQTGIDYEKDPALRARRDNTTAKGGGSTIEAFYAVLADLNLPYIRIRDNDTDAAIGSQPAGTVYAVVGGGTADEIGRRLFSVKPGGVSTHGSIVAQVFDSKGYPHDIRFSRPQPLSIYVKGTFKRRLGSNISSNDAAKTLTTAMMNHLATLQPGESVIWSECFAPLMESTQFLQIDSLLIGISSNALSTNSIEIDIDQHATADESNITFTDVTN